MPKNYYVILGIPVNSSRDTIKEAYRRLAKEYHPDYYAGNHAPFMIIHEAYSILSDPSKRRDYDSRLQARKVVQPNVEQRPVGRRISPEIEPLIPEKHPEFSPSTSLDRSIHHYNDLFDGFFDRLLSGFSEERSPQYTLNRTIEVRLTPDQAKEGGNVRLMVPMQIHCPSCSRSGYRSYRDCWRCNGSGYLNGEKQVVISYPPGVAAGHTVHLAINLVGEQDIFLTAVFTIT